MRTLATNVESVETVDFTQLTQAISLAVFYIRLERFHSVRLGGEPLCRAGFLRWVRGVA